MKNLEKRVANLEIALVALLAIIGDTLPPEYLEDAEKMMNDMFDANASLGGCCSAEFYSDID